MGDITTYAKIRATGDEKLLGTDNGITKNIVGALNPNNIKSWGAIGDGTSHPLSESYATLQLAQVDYPFAENLADEKDWSAFNACVKQSITDYIVSTDLKSVYCSIYVPSGVYLFNKQLDVWVGTFSLQGEMKSTDTKGSSVLKYTGTAGTEDANKYIIDLRVVDNLGQDLSGYTSGNEFIGCDISKITFTTTLTGISYVSAMCLYSITNSSISKCTTIAGLYDGIVIKGSAMLSFIEKCFFYGISRDAISVMRCSYIFTTSITIRDNEFGEYGRYAIIIDAWGGSTQGFVIENNDFEGTYTSGYYSDLANYVYGIRANVCLLNCNDTKLLYNRFENNHYEYCYHFVRSNNILLIGNAYETNKANAITTCEPNTAYTNFLAANGFCDITATRNLITNVGYLTAMITSLDRWFGTFYNIESALNMATNATIIIGEAKLYNVALVEDVPDVANKVLSNANVKINNGIWINGKAVLTEP